MAKLVRARAEEMYGYTVVSRRKGEGGSPVNDEHVLWESCQGEAMAMAYARHRVNEGRWVDVFKNVAYSIEEKKIG